MDLSKITHPLVKMAVEYLQRGDEKWYGYFIDDPTMTDDGRNIDFKSFFKNALGTEKFLNIDRVENDGKDIYGKFDAGKWGIINVYFKFHENTTGKFIRLDIGQY